MSHEKNKYFKVLIVEDSKTIRSVVKRAINKKFPGAYVLDADGGRVAFDIIKNESPHIVITDIEMPDMRGDEMINSAKKNGFLKNAKIIVLTSVMYADKNLHIEDKKGIEFLRKPITGDEISSHVLRIIDGFIEKEKLDEALNHNHAEKSGNIFNRALAAIQLQLASFIDFVMGFL